MSAAAAVLGILILWALVSRRLASWSITMAIAMTIAGALLASGSDPVVDLNPVDGKAEERFVEVVLAILLFLDATEVPHGILGREPRITLRLLLIALPLSLGLAVLAGVLVLPTDDLWILGLIAIIVVPVDLAPAVSIVRDRRVPARLREIVNVEAGLNDGMVAPLFLFCLAGATAQGGKSAADALVDAGPAIVISLVAGAAVGALGAGLLGRSWRRRWSEPSAIRVAVLALPVLTYAVANALGGNGFVAAFVAGVLFNIRAPDLPSGALEFSEDAATLLSMGVWFLFGSLAADIWDLGVGLEEIAYALVALTVVRILPVLIALIGTTIRFRDGVFIGWMGPRGLASIVFGLLALIDTEDADILDKVGVDIVLAVKVMVVTVLMSVVLHGVSAGPIARAYARRAARDPAADPDVSDPSG